MIEVGWEEPTAHPLRARTDLSSYRASHALGEGPGNLRYRSRKERLEELGQARVASDPHGGDEWFQTFTGRRFFFNDPKPEAVCIVDVFHALPGITRFGAQAKRINGRCYSVGEHSCLIAWYAQHMLRRPKEDVKLALLHDAAEAYTGDIKRPLKNAVPGIRTAVRRVEAVVAEALGVPNEKPGWLAELDQRIIVDEKEALMGRPADGTAWSHERAGGLLGLDVPIRCLAPDTVEQWMYEIYQEVRDA